MILSGKTGEPVSMPVERERYDAFLAELQKTSVHKASIGPDKRITDERTPLIPPVARYRVMNCPRR
jgi:hypothetical protein